MTIVKTLSLFLALSATAPAIAAPFVHAKLEEVGPFMDGDFDLGNGQVIEHDWFAFSLTFQNRSSEGDFVVEASDIIGDFDGSGHCTIVPDNARDQRIVVRAGESYTTRALFCPGLDLNIGKNNMGSIIVRGKMTTGEQLPMSLPIIVR